GGGGEGREGAGPVNVTFVGELHGQELARLYASADIFCFPSTTDTFGQVLLEAAASGLPVVAAAAGGAVELVRDGETGLLVEPDDPQAFADAVRALALLPQRRAVLGAADGSPALAHTWERWSDDLRPAYRLAAGRSRLWPTRVAA